MAPHAESLVAEPTQNDLQRLSKVEMSSCSSEPVAASQSDATKADCYDLLCIGFGPASLAIAIALSDRFEYGVSGSLPDTVSSGSPNVAFLDRLSSFTWHQGMQLPNGRMQITFLKDLATFRNPRSRFTFINYLHAHGRLASFTNLSTFLPSRAEYEDYMKWCAEAFADKVNWNTDVLSVTPVVAQEKGLVQSFDVTSRNLVTGALESRRARHIVIATGGQAALPEVFSQFHPLIIHSSTYLPEIESRLPAREGAYAIAVIGAGQSSVETFMDLQVRYPRARTRLLIRGGALRPSDDSPFVNEIFDPDRITSTYESDASARQADLQLDRGTNYSVVRSTLLEELYARLYEQRVEHDALCRSNVAAGRAFEVAEKKDEDWMQHCVLPYRTITSVEDLKDRNDNFSRQRVRLHMDNASSQHGDLSAPLRETLDVDAVIVATGYTRNAHQKLLAPCWDLREENSKEWSVQRDYRVRFRPGIVGDRAGIWLQGCCEASHGLSDSLLSILSIRAGELVDSIFGKT